MPSLHETVRPDGLRIISKFIPGTYRVRLVVRCNRAGSVYDPPGYEGLYHFIEHLVLADTKTRTSEEIQALVGRYLLDQDRFADIGATNTTYWGESLYTHFKVLCDLIFDLYVNPLFPAKKLAPERKVIRADIATEEDDDLVQVGVLLGRLLWRKDPQIKVVEGTPESRRRINHTILVAAHDTVYIPSNTVVVAAGRVDHDELVKRVDAFFPIDHRKTRARTWPDESGEPPVQNEIIVRKKGREKASIAIGCKVPPPEDKERVLLKVLADMLGEGGEDSLLWKIIREKFGNMYWVSTLLHSESHGLGYKFYSRTEVIPEMIDEVRKLVVDVMCGYPLSRNHFERQIESERDRCFVEFERPEDWCNEILRRVVEEGKPVSHLYKYVQRKRKFLSGLRFRELVALRKKILTPERLACAIIRP